MCWLLFVLNSHSTLQCHFAVATREIIIKLIFYINAYNLHLIQGLSAVFALIVFEVLILSIQKYGEEGEKSSYFPNIDIILIKIRAAILLFQSISCIVDYLFENIHLLYEYCNFLSLSRYSRYIFFHIICFFFFSKLRCWWILYES